MSAPDTLGRTGRAKPVYAAPGTDRGRINSVWHQHRTALSRLIVLTLFFGAWEVSVSGGFVNPLFLSSPTMVAIKMYEMFADGSIWVHLWATGKVVVLGYSISVLIGVPLGTLMGRSVLVRDTLEPFIMAQYSAPTAAFLPLLIIWFGIGLWSKVILVVLGGVFVIIINTQAGVANVDRRLIETARSFRASEMQILRKVVAPSALPFIIAGLRLAIGRVLIMVVVAELFAANAGIGYLIFQAGAMYDTTLIFVGVTILAVTGVFLNSCLRRVERRLAPWNQPDAA